MNEWLTLTLADVCTVITDGAHQSPKTVSRGKPMASVKDLTRFGVDLKSARHIAIEDFEALAKQGCKPQVGDVLIAKDGNSALDTVCTVAHALDAVLLSSVAILRPDPNCLDSVFLKFYLSSPETIEYLKSNFISGAAIPRVVLRDFKRAEIRLPSLDVQRRIAGILQSIDSKIDLNRRINQTLETIAQAIFKSWFVDFDPVKAKIAAKQEGRDPLRAAMSAISGKPDAELDALPPEQYEQLAAIAALFPDEMQDSELGEIPKGWEPGGLSSVCGLNTESWSAKTLPASVKYVDLANTKNGEVIEVQTMEGANIPSRARRILKVGDTIIGTVRPGNRSFALVGEAGLTGSTGFAVLHPRKSYLREYVYLAATADSNIERLAHLADGGAYPAVRPELVVSDALPIPSEDLLREFHRISSPMFDQLLGMRRANRSLAALRDALLPKLLSGELSVTEAMAEAEA
ncbi:MAG: restriction endonuclease subunit S [Candidatus Igneacidithiobacillus chanchocoensis]